MGRGSTSYAATFATHVTNASGALFASSRSSLEFSMFSMLATKSISNSWIYGSINQYLYWQIFPFLEVLCQIIDLHKRMALIDCFYDNLPHKEY